MFIYFEDNAGVIVNNKGEMKGERNEKIIHVHPMGDRHPMSLFTLHYLPELPMSGHWYVLDSIPGLSLHVLTINVGNPVSYSC